jgi:hypothetical protein
MNYKANFVATLLAACLWTAHAAESLVHLEAKGQTVENGKTIDMEFTEVERRSDASIVQVLLRSGGSVSSSLFILRGMCSVARARKELYFRSTRLPAPEGRYIVRFPRDVPSTSEAAPAGEVFSVAQCDRLGS